MATVENDPFLALLFSEQAERTLTNIKFFVGPDCMDGATLRAAAYAALSSAFADGRVRTDNPPKMMPVQRSVQEFLAEI